MGQRQVLLIATFLTTFGIILVGAVAVRLITEPGVGEVTAVSGDTLQAASAGTAASVTPADPQAVDALLASRESAYEQALEQARTQLEDANQRLADLQESEGSGAATAPPDTVITPEYAAILAASAAPDTAVTAAPLLIDFQGTAAYEITTERGLIYLDANSGVVLHNGVTSVPLEAPVSSAAVPAAPVSETRALEIAISAVGPGTVDKMELEEEHSILVWDVKFTNDNEARIDAATGAIVRTRIENDFD